MTSPHHAAQSVDFPARTSPEPKGGPATSAAPATSSLHGDHIFSLFAVFRVSSSHPITFDGHDVPGVVREFEDVVELVAGEHVELRGCYDVSGMRADSDLMLWLHGRTAEDLQWALRQLRRTTLLRPLIRVWGAVGVHRDAEFNRAHVPAYLRGVQPSQWLALYPFDRSYDWYLLDPQERSRMLAEHGRAGADFAGVQANTLSAFALGDYEWILPLEAEELTDLVDMMRVLRGVDARLHVREETPFFTGRRIEPAEIVEVLQ